MALFSDSDWMLRTVEQKRNSVNIRIEILKPILEVFADNPIFGSGYGKVDKLIYDQLGYKLTAHNIFFGVLLHYGILTLFLFLYLLMISLKDLVKAYEVSIKWEYSYYIVTNFTILIALIFNGLFHDSILLFYFWYVLSQSRFLLKKAI